MFHCRLSILWIPLSLAMACSGDRATPPEPSSAPLPITSVAADWDAPRKPYHPERTALTGSLTQRLGPFIHQSRRTATGPAGVGWNYKGVLGTTIVSSGSDYTFYDDDGIRTLYDGTGAAVEPTGRKRIEVSGAELRLVDHDGQAIIYAQQGGSTAYYPVRAEKFGYTTQTYSWSATSPPMLEELRDDAGNLIAKFVNSAGRVTEFQAGDDLSRGLQFTYTSGQLSAIRVKNGGADEVLTIANNAQGTPVQLTMGGRKSPMLTFSGDGALQSSMDPVTGYEEVHSYCDDGAGGHEHRLTTSHGVEVVTSFDSSLRLTSRTTTSNGQSETHLFEFSPAAHGMMTKHTEPSGKQHSWTHDARGNILSVAEDSVTQQSWTYTANDRIATSTDRLGRVTSYTYDAAGLQIGVTYPSGGSLTTERNAAGWPLRTRNGSGVVVNEVAYDSRWRVTSRSVYGTQVQAVTYDARSRPMSIDMGGGRTANVTRNGVGQVASITGNPGGQTATLAYDAGGALTSYTSPGLTMTQTRDSHGRVVSNSVNGVTRSVSFSPSGEVDMASINGVEQSNGHISANLSYQPSAGGPTCTPGGGGGDAGAGGCGDSDCDGYDDCSFEWLGDCGGDAGSGGCGDSDCDGYDDCSFEWLGDCGGDAGAGGCGDNDCDGYDDCSFEWLGPC